VRPGVSVPVVLAADPLWLGLPHQHVSTTRVTLTSEPVGTRNDRRPTPWGAEEPGQTLGLGASTGVGPASAQPFDTEICCTVVASGRQQQVMAHHRTRSGLIYGVLVLSLADMTLDLDLALL
jgi:hypothetical protein